GDQVHVAPASAVAAVGPTLGHELLSAKGTRAPAAVAGADTDQGLVDQAFRHQLPRCFGAPEARILGLGRCRLGAVDRDQSAVVLGLELHHALGHRVEGVVAADADVLAGPEAVAALAHDDVARADQLAAVTLDSQHLRLAVPPVLGRAHAL